MDNKDLLSAIDNGTQSLKALIFDLEGQQVLEMGFTPEALFDRLIDEIPQPETFLERG